MLTHGLEQCPAQITLLQQVPKSRNPSLVGRRIGSEVDANKSRFPFKADNKRDAGPDVTTPHAKIGQPALEYAFLQGALGRIEAASAKR